MIGVLAVLTVRDGMQGAFEEAATALALAVRANETGCVLYTFVKSRTDPVSYTAMELYKTAEDVVAHGTSAHFKALSPALGACLAAPPQVTQYDVVA